MTRSRDAENPAAPGARPQAAGGRLARQVDDGVDRGVARDLVEMRDHAERRAQRRRLGRIAHEHDDLVARAGERFDQASPDEAGAAGDEHALPGRQCPRQLRRIAGNEPSDATRGVKVTQPEQDHAQCRQGGERAADAVPDRNDRSRLHRPAEQDRDEQRQDGAIVDRQQRMGDPLARRQLAAQVLLDEVDQRDDELRRQHGDHQHGRHAVRLGEAEHEEEHGIGEVSHGMQNKLAPLRTPPCDPLGQLVMIENVEQAHRELGGDQRPERTS